MFLKIKNKPEKDSLYKEKNTWTLKANSNVHNKETIKE